MRYKMALKKYVRIHGKKRRYDDILEALEWCRERRWFKEKWETRLEPISDESIEDLNDSEIHDYQEIGLLYDYCEICQWKLYETDDPEKGEGYSCGEGVTKNDDRWICSECYVNFIQIKN